MDSHAVSETFLDDFSPALVLDNTTTVLPFSGDMSSIDFLEDLSWRPDIAMAETALQHTQALEGLEFPSGFMLQMSELGDSESLAVPQAFELPPELAPTAFELNAQLLDSMPLVSTPGFVALQASQAAATSARRPRKPREYVLRP
jgi:hypothetical protein